MEFCLKYTCIPTNAFENSLNLGTRIKFKQRSVIQNVIKEMAVIVDFDSEKILYVFCAL